MLRSVLAGTILTFSLLAWGEPTLTISVPREASKRALPVTFDPSLGFGWRHQNDSGNHMEWGPGLDVTYAIGRYFSAGLGASLTLGEDPGFDFGGGPFLAFTHQIHPRFAYGLRQDICGGMVRSNYDYDYLTATTSPFIGVLVAKNFWINGAYRFGYSLKNMHTDWPGSSALVSMSYNWSL